MGILSLVVPKRFERMPADLQLATWGCAIGVAIGMVSVLMVAIFKGIGLNLILGTFIGLGFLLFTLNLILNTIEENFIKE